MEGTVNVVRATGELREDDEVVATGWTGGSNVEVGRGGNWVRAEDGGDDRLGLSCYGVSTTSMAQLNMM